MSAESKRKGRKTITRHSVDRMEGSAEGDHLSELFEVFIKAKEAEGLRERTLVVIQRKYG